MKVKNIIVLCFIFVLIGSMSIVSAGDNNESVISEDLSDEMLSMENNIQINETSLSQNNAFPSDNTLKSSEETFSSFYELNDTISKAESIITLNKNYIFNPDTDLNL